MSGPPCAMYAPDDTEFPRVSGAEQARWIANVFANFFDEPCMAKCTGNVDLPCQGAAVTDACMGCIVQQGCAEDILKCGKTLNSTLTSLGSVEKAVTGTSSRRSKGLSDAAEIGIAVGVVSAVAIIITVAVVVSKQRKTS